MLSRRIRHMTLKLRRNDLFRVIVALVAEEVSRQQVKHLSPSDSLAWTEETPLDDDGIGLDSLARIDTAGRINQFFHLHESGIEDYLLLERTLGGWTTIVAKGLELSANCLTFQTSGSTGRAKACTHQIPDLTQEVAELGTHLAGTKRVLSLVPPHHIYGFLFSVMLPNMLDIPILDARLWGPGAFGKRTEESDLVVATPHLWSYLSTSIPQFPSSLTGVTSTAPMPDDLARHLQAQGLSRLLQVYGSSETAGIATRWMPEEPFTLFSHWRKDKGGASLTRVLTNGMTGAGVPLLDTVDWLDERRFRLFGRRDGAVQIGGINVFPSRVAAVMAEHACVESCVVRAFAVGDDAAKVRLKAFVVLKADVVNASTIEAQLTGHAKERLSALECPVSWTFGPEPPVNAMGKPADW
jgi:long-chain acyl-CoA synthetase